MTDQKKSASRFRFVDSPLFFPISIFIVLIFAYFFYIHFHQHSKFDVFYNRPAIVFIDEQSLFRSMEHHLPESAMTSPSAMGHYASYLSNILDRAIHHYHSQGTSVVLSKGVISVPKKDDVTPLLRSQLIAYIKDAAHAKS